MANKIDSSAKRLIEGGAAKFAAKKKNQ